jgi:hypothetical protein
MQIHAGPGRPSSAAAPALAARLRRKLLVLWRSLTGYRQSEQVLGEDAGGGARRRIALARRWRLCR